jgi:hypothetical protein
MTGWSRVFASFAVAALPTHLAVATGSGPEAATTSVTEPFHSFRLIDAKLTLLSNQQAALNSALSSSEGSSSPRTVASGTVTRILAQMSSAITEIERIAARLERLYQSRHEPFGVRAFGILRRRAQLVERVVRSVGRARTQSDRAVAEKRLNQHLVSLVVQFQAVSGGYGATHCLPRTRICCQPKRSQDLQPDEDVACRWLCVSGAPACRGFLGPHVR